VTEPLVLAIDQGTTNTKAVVIGMDGAVRASSSVRVGIEFPVPGWVQSDAHDIWHSVLKVTAECLDHVPAGSVQSIGISNQRESVVAWDRTNGSPLGPVISWQCGRTASRCAELSEAGYGEMVRARTGLVLGPMFSASKMAWLLEAIEDGAQRAADGEICLGTIDSWLIWNFSGGESFVTDHTNASRTLLLDLTSREWADELLEVFGIPRHCLPSVQPSISSFGVARLSGGVPIGGVAGDSHAALVGHRALVPGVVKATFGTGTSVMAPVESLSRAPQLSSTIAWSQRGMAGDETTYALEGNIYATGAALEWTAALLGLAGDVGALGELARSCASSSGVCFVPALSGLGAPYWEASARGLMSGLTHGAGPPEVSRAAFEAVAHQVVDVLDCLHGALGSSFGQICADGGAIRSDLLASIVADISGVAVLRNDEREVAALGAALLAGVSAGMWPDLQSTEKLPLGCTTFEPRISGVERRHLRQQWADAMHRTVMTGPS
jgi:glycerol kinase